MRISCAWDVSREIMFPEFSVHSIHCILCSLLELLCKFSLLVLFESIPGRKFFSRGNQVCLVRQWASLWLSWLEHRFRDCVVLIERPRFELVPRDGHNRIKRAYKLLAKKVLLTIESNVQQLTSNFFLMCQDKNLQKTPRVHAASIPNNTGRMHTGGVGFFPTIIPPGATSLRWQ